MKRGKPLKQETQILVEETGREKRIEAGKLFNLDKWLHITELGLWTEYSLWLKYEED